MDRTSKVRDRIREWIRTNFPLAAEQNLGPHDALLDSGIIDSLGTLELVEFLEGEFEIHITDDEMVADHFASIHSLAEFVDSKISEDEGQLKAT